MKKSWVIVATFFKGAEDRWLDDFIDSETHVFRKRSPPSFIEGWHFRRSKRTGASSWLSYLRHARSAFEDRPDGIITCFPQLAMCVAFLKLIGGHKPKIVAYNYNLGGFPDGIKRLLARFVAHQIDAYVVHAPSEVCSYSSYLGISRDRVRFIPLQRGEIQVVRKEDTEAPFVLAMGSAHRDYSTLIIAVDALAVPTVIVTKPSEAEGLPQSPYVTIRSKMTEKECIDLLARARLSVTPISNLTTASGQITIINAMQLGIPVIATRCPGTDGYIKDGQTGLLVEAFDCAELQAAISMLWSDLDRRNTLSVAARAEARLRFSDQAAAVALEALLDDIALEEIENIHP